MTFKTEVEVLTKVNHSDLNTQTNPEDMVNLVSILRLPWRFTDKMTEHTYIEKRGMPEIRSYAIIC
jgi:hypothetical protein